MNLLEISNQYRIKAENFLKNSKLIEVLERYGRVEYEGAYAGNVMMNGDIDIKVIGNGDFTVDDMFTILRDLHDTCGDDFRSYFLKRDWDDPRIGNQFPHGQYIGLKMFIDDELWKCDIWFMSESESESERDRKELQIDKMDLTEEKRRMILEFKKYRKDHKLKVSGQNIYIAVLQNGQTDPERFFSNQKG